MMELIRKLEAATGPDRELEWSIAQAIGHPSMAHASNTFFPPFMPGSRADKEIPEYTRSLDAALTLVGNIARIECELTFDWSWWSIDGIEGAHKNRAIAFVIAALKARDGEEESRG